MNANSKKLLSLVVAIALVLSMTPAISLQAEAAFDPAGTVCEHCGGKAVKWEDLAGTYTATEALTTGHYYLSASITVGTFTQGPLFTVAAGQKVCVNLNGYNITNGNNSNSTGQCFKVSGELAIMSEGNASTTQNCVSGKTNNAAGENAGTVIANGGDVTIYGGRYENTRSASRHSIYARSGGTVTIKGGVFNRPVNASDTGDTLNIEGGQFNYAVTCAGTARVTGGTFNVTNPSAWLANTTCYSVSAQTPYTVTASHDWDEGVENPVHDCTTDGVKTYTCEAKGCGITMTETVPGGHDFGDNAATCSGCGAANPDYVDLPKTCPMCGAGNVSWTAVTTAGSITDSGHYYLKNHITGNNKNTYAVAAGKEVCLDLNGCNITNLSTVDGPAALKSEGILRVMGEGIVKSNGSGVKWAPIYADQGGTVKIYGGTYVTEVEGRNAVSAQDGEGNIVEIYGGTFSSKPSANFVPGTHWALPNADKWSVEELTEAAFIKADGYTTGTAAEVVSGSNLNGYILIGNADAIALTKDAYVDNRGNAVTVTGSGKLYAMDSVGNGAWTAESENIVREVTNPVNNKRYLTVGNESYEFELKLTQVVLRAGLTSNNMGLYYKAAINTSEELADLVEAYGAVFSLVDAPDKNFRNDADSRFTMIDCDKNPLAGGEAVMTSGSIFGIMDENTPAENAGYGEMPIHANAYIALDLDGDGNEEYIMASNNASHSLKSVMVAINGMEVVPEVVKTFYGHWAQYGMNAWASELGKITAA